jgi:hypothetical protein
VELLNTHPPSGPIALVVWPQGFAELRRLPASDITQADILHEAVGGYLESIGPGEWIAFLNTDGKEQGLKPNLHADALARALGWTFRVGDYLVGAAVFASRDGTAIGDCPQRVVDLVRTAGIPVRISGEAVPREAR